MLRHPKGISKAELVNAFGPMLKQDGKNPEEVAEKIRLMTEGQADPLVVSKKARAFAKACFYQPSKHEMILEAINELLDGHGVEALQLPDGDPVTFTDEGVRMCPAFSYVNMGDPYAATVLRDHEHGSWLVACWGDVLEEFENTSRNGSSAG